MNNGYADKASWTLPNGVTLQPGQSSDGYTATHQMVILANIGRSNDIECGIWETENSS